MTIEMSGTQAQANLPKLLDNVIDDREIIVIRRDDGENVALIAADELLSLLETAYLMRSEANAARLLSALGRALKQGGESYTVDDLREKFSLDS